MRKATKKEGKNFYKRGKKSRKTTERKEFIIIDKYSAF